LVTPSYFRHLEVERWGEGAVARAKRSSEQACGGLLAEQDIRLLEWQFEIYCGKMYVNLKERDYLADLGVDGRIL
jgi:hypothetical protein